MEDKFYMPDIIFPSDNELEIPSLLLDVQPKGCEIPFVCFGEQKRTFKMNGAGTLHFYTDDSRFMRVYDHPEQIYNHHPANIVEPNYSLFAETPLAFGLQAVYKKRTLARQMQENGIGVFVDLNVANKWYAFNLLGVPKGYGSFCTRGYEDRINSLEFEYNIAQMVASGNKLTFVVYGGGEKVKEWCREHGCVYVAKVIDIKNKLRSFKSQMKNISLPTESMMQKIAELKSDMFAKQVLDFREILTLK